jgi:hypothetical protein
MDGRPPPAATAAPLPPGPPRRLIPAHTLYGLRKLGAGPTWRVAAAVSGDAEAGRPTHGPPPPPVTAPGAGDDDDARAAALREEHDALLAALVGVWGTARDAIAAAAESGGADRVRAGALPALDPTSDTTPPDTPPAAETTTTRS